ncbi:MAG: 3-hydroxybutyryl-CoA dehydrogenase [Candidatus Thorarchaeota archaeon]|nr:3-hydroxybutyryl-CoA dehydrogenase [Candidatus Thorarchaeota archaeon]MCK5238733.1 3-hydroxybutyryl-CoA dehydrogenase [Candidatus Thorarchaeota archaeon]
MEINKMVVIGAGLMGAGIAYVTASKGIHVTLVDVNQAAVDAGLERIRNDVMTGVDKGKLSLAEAQGLMGNLSTSIDAAEASKEADLIIEAIFENMEVKKKVFAEVDAAAPPHAILASNTSTLSIDEMASVTSRPEKFVGMHYFSPVAAMKLLEIIRGEKTSDETVAAAKVIGEKQGKTTVTAKNSPGFIVNRILIPGMREAILLYESGAATKEEIDLAMTTIAKYPAGPFALADFVGLDVAYHSGLTLERELGDCFKVPDILKNLVDSGALGTKTKKGFYNYGGEPDEPEPPKGADPEWIVTRLAMPVLRTAMLLVDEGIAEEKDIDLAMKLGAAYPEGPFETLNRMGRDKVKAELQKLYEEYGECYSVPKYLE